MSFTIKPASISGEAPIGYLLRLAQRQGFISVNRLFSQSVIQRVVKGIDTKDADLNNLLPRRTIPESRSPIFRHARSLTPRICTQCVAEQGTLQESWHNPFKLNCNKHGVELMSCCPHCNQILKWDIALLEGRCTNPRCCKLLTNKLKTLVLTQDQALDCLMAAYVEDTECNVSPLTRYYPKIDDISAAIHQGHRLLNDFEKANNWMNTIVSSVASVYPISIAQYKLRTFLGCLSQSWPIHKIELPSYEMRKSNSVSYSADAGTLMSLLDISHAALVLLIEKGLSYTVTGARLTASTFVNIQPLFEWLTTRTTRPEMKSICSYSEEMAYFDTSVEDVLLGAINGNLTIGYQTGPTFIESLNVLPEEFETFMTKNFSSKEYKDVSIEKAVKLTGLPKSRLLFLRKQGLFRPPRWRRAGSEYYVEYEDVLAIRASISNHHNDITRMFA